MVGSKKKVVINEANNSIHYMIAWVHAYKQARLSTWREDYLDRVRFTNRIKKCEHVLSTILDVEHRLRIYSERFVE